MKTEGPVIQLSHVHAGYQGTRESILHDVNLEVRLGEFFAIIGPNGGGKTTLLRLILGLLQPRSGHCLVFGESPADVRARIGYVPQFSQCRRDFPIRVREMVGQGLLGTPFAKLGGGQRRQAIVEALQHAGALAYADKRVSELSGGQFQRALIARALVRQPEMLILDEPTASLDPVGEEALMGLFAEFVPSKTVLFVSHDVHYVMKSVERVACVNRTVHVHRAAHLAPEDTHEIYGYETVAVQHDHGFSSRVET